MQAAMKRAMLAATAIFTGALAAAGAQAEAAASHDGAVVRTVGLGWTGIFRGLDVLVGAAGAFVPLGTRALGVALMSAVVAAAAAAVAFLVAHAFVEAVVPPVVARFARRADAPPVHPALLAGVAAAAVLTATLSPVFQAEASVPGGAVLGALLVLAAVGLAQRVYSAHIRALALVCGLAASFDPFVLGAVLAAAAPWVLRWIVRSPEPSRQKKPAGAGNETVDAVIAFALGLSPLLISAALAQRVPEIALMTRAFGLDAAPAAARTTIRAFASNEIGMLAVVAALVGAVAAAMVPEARRVLASLAAVVIVGAIAIPIGAPASSTHASGAILAAILALHVLVAVALAIVVIAIARMRVPFAQASAALVVVLELVLPVRAADETSGRRETRAPRAVSTWDEMAWGAAPPAAVVLAPDRATMNRIAAARATGAMRGDLVIVPSFDLDARQAHRALAAEPKLAPLYRDVALGVAPEELSLAQLASQRALIATFDPRWDRALARHLVPLGLMARLEPEPRGASDRKRALDAFASAKERLVRVALPKRDPDLAAATAALLRARAIAMAACGEKEILSHALDDLRPFAPDDPVATTLVRRMVTSKGTIDVKDLTP
jgi:hypothetical protein